MEAVGNDRNGEPIYVGSFVRVERASTMGSSPTEFRGQVVRCQRNAAGDLLWISVWHSRGGTMGRERPARADECVTLRKPQRLKQDEIERARRKVDAQRRT